ncbi:restriction endonuclease subunit S [Agathobacter rectalis]|uniref:restriction endonuclease subunit S n=1 Tax=Agathobacter rectalis TaxID=39491 RepID=UPI0027D280FC|nr:restriction endonuclease subunit S [Agathobacter rectalis]
MKKDLTPTVRFDGYKKAWKKEKLSRIVDVKNGMDYKHLQRGDIPVYGTGGYMLSVNEALSYKDDAVGIGRKGTIDKPYILKAPFWTVDTLFYAVPKENNDINFVFGLFQNVDWKKKDESTGVPSLTKNAINDTDVFVTDYVEQKTIGEYFKNFDDMIKLHQQEIDRLVCVRKAMIEKMFPQNGADVPAVRFGQYKEPWRLCQFSEIFKERHIIDTISDEYPQLAFTIEEGVIRPEDKKTNKRDFLIIDKANKKYLQTEYDDIIYNPANVIYGAIHRNALGKGCVSPIYKIFYTDQDSTFMECIVRHPRFIKEISRSMEGTVKKLRTLKPKAFLEKRAYIAPSIEEQQQIGEYFRQMDRLIEIEKEELEKIKHIKSACMEKMFV